MTKYAIILFAVLVIAAEGVLRWGVGLGDPPLARLDPVTEYELVPYATYQRWGNTISINAHGMRTDAHPDLPEEGAQHLLLIGDSVVYGGHFLQQYEIISAHLQNLLAERSRFARCTLRVLPLAVSSWGPVNQAAAVQKYGVFGASTAGIVVSGHDLYDVPRTNADVLPYRTLPSRTALGDAFQAVLERRDRVSDEAVAEEPPLALWARLSLAALDEMTEALTEQDVRPVLIYHPTVSERGGPTSVEQTRFQDWAESRGIAFFDLGSVQMTPDDYRDDIHPTASGAQRIAQALTPVLGENLRPCPSG